MGVNMTVAKEMALAVLMGDELAALALADRIKEDASTDAALAAGVIKEVGPIAGDGYSVWQWPEFQAFAKRLGFDVHGRTRSLVITIKVDEAVTLQHEVLASDTGPVT